MNDDLYRRIGASIRAARQSRGIAQEDLGSAVGLGRSSIANIEAGRQHPTIHTLIAACQAVGLDPADVITQAIEGRAAPGSLPVDSRALLAMPVRRRLAAVRDDIDRILKETP